MAKRGTTNHKKVIDDLRATLQAEAMALEQNRQAGIDQMKSIETELVRQEGELRHVRKQLALLDQLQAGNI